LDKIYKSWTVIYEYEYQLSHRVPKNSENGQSLDCHLVDHNRC